MKKAIGGLLLAAIAAFMVSAETLPQEYSADLIIIDLEKEQLEQIEQFLQQFDPQEKQTVQPSELTGVLSVRSKQSSGQESLVLYRVLAEAEPADSCFRRCGEAGSTKNPNEAFYVSVWCQEPGYVESDPNRSLRHEKRWFGKH